MSDYTNRKTALTIFEQWDHINPNWTLCGENKFKDLDVDIWADWKQKYCPNCGTNMEETNGEKETL